MSQVERKYIIHVRDTISWLITLHTLIGYFELCVVFRRTVRLITIDNGCRHLRSTKAARRMQINVDKQSLDSSKVKFINRPSRQTYWRYFLKKKYEKQTNTLRKVHNAFPIIKFREMLEKSTWETSTPTNIITHEMQNHQYRLGKFYDNNNNNNL